MLHELTRKAQALYVPTSQVLLLSAQQRLLQHFCGRAVDIESRRSAGGLNYIVVTAAAAPAASSTPTPTPTASGKTLLLVHGFGSGLGFFFSNYAALASSYDRVVAVDLLGMGGSDRVDLSLAPRISTPQLVYQFFTGNHARVDAEAVPRSMSFFTESLEKFCDEVMSPGDDDRPPIGGRKRQQKQQRIHVAGHSLGGLLCWNFALRNKERVEALILVSPCGVPSPPPDAAATATTAPTSATLTAIRFLWENNVTPQQLIRLAGSRGLGIITDALNRRFNRRWDKTEAGLIADYFYHISAAPASGEYALSSLLRPVVYRDAETGEVVTSIFAKRSIEQDVDDAIAAASRHSSSSSPSSSSSSSSPSSSSSYPPPRSKAVPFPVLLQFGDHDWLRFKNVEAFVDKARDKAGMDIRYDLVPSAGHHLYLDNSDAFHASIARFRARHSI